jgi:SAM-dependent methyltransferase
LALVWGVGAEAKDELAGLDRILPARFFARTDESDDAAFYAVPRLVTHVDDATIAALTQVYRELVPAGARVLDLLSSWVSHLPEDVTYARVAGHGMNADELAANRRLDERVVQDVNRDPSLPFPDASFDVALNAFSVQYLVRPLAVLHSVRRVLAPGGTHAVALSHRMFPTKAIAIWQALDMEDRARLVGVYFRLAGGWTEPVVMDRSPAGADPLWVVAARRAA